MSAEWVEPDNVDRCPHCRSVDYGPVTDHVNVCLACGYDTEYGTDGVCPGGRHPLVWRGRSPWRTLCCDGCYSRIPRDLPGFPRWRSRARGNFAAMRSTAYSYDQRLDNEQIKAAAETWLADHPRETENP